MSRTTRGIGDWDWTVIAGALGAAGALIGGIAGAGEGDGTPTPTPTPTPQPAPTNWGKIIGWVVIALLAVGLVLLMVKLFKKR